MKNIIFTDSVINDTINKITYKKLTKWQEQDYIKKAKLSFYYEIDEKMQELYLVILKINHVILILGYLYIQFILERN